MVFGIAGAVDGRQHEGVPIATCGKRSPESPGLPGGIMRYHRHDAAHKGFSKDRDGVCPKQLVWGGTQGRKGEGPATERLFIQVRHENGLSPLAHG